MLNARRLHANRRGTVGSYKMTREDTMVFGGRYPADRLVADRFPWYG